MPTPQPGILEGVPQMSRYLEFGLVPDEDPTPALKRLAEQEVDARTVVGIGVALAPTIEGLTPFPALSSSGLAIPSTQSSLWLWLRGDDRGEILHHARSLSALLGPAFRCDSQVDGFMYRDSRDLSGYIDGTENPEGEEAEAAALVSGKGPGLDGSSFVAVQQWVHDLSHFEALSPETRDDVFGRHISNNEEFDEAPESAHVKRTAQESFTPEAFMVRRSMPWASPDGEGLVFIAFGNSFYAFDTVLRRMIGEEDGITDGLFRFTRPVTGSYFWCPPVKGGKLDLSALGL
jgi:putative iron-dependent peroxidase